MRELSFTSAGGGSRKLRLHEPEGKPSAVVQIVHGMAEHYARYYPLAEALAAAGIAVAGHDHLGHGPDTPKEKLGYFAPQDGWQKLTDDVHHVHCLLKERYPDSRHILLGHSMGSFLAREYLLQHGGKGLDGLVLSGTTYMAAPMLNAAIPLARLPTNSGLAFCKARCKTGLLTFSPARAWKCMACECLAAAVTPRPRPALRRYAARGWFRHRAGAGGLRYSSDSRDRRPPRHRPRRRRSNRTCGLRSWSIRRRT